MALEKQVSDMPSTFTNEFEIIVSVSLITYNQKKFIGQAIDSVLEQKTTFKYELIIGDDCSTDGTREILLYYQKKHPDIIKLILHENKGDGIPGKKNFVSTIYASKGKYIALLDGDDFWNDKNKLQKQVDFLETNPDYAICFHQVHEKYPNGRKQVSTLVKEKNATTYTIEDLAKGNFIYVPSVVFRNKLFNKFPEWFWEAPAGDYLVHMLNAAKGKIRFLPNVMATYRRHSAGFWTAISSAQRHKNIVKVIELLLKGDFSYPVQILLKQQLVQSQNNFLLNLLLQQEYDLFKKELKIYLETYPERKDSWLFEIYPNFNQTVAESNTFKLAKRIVSIARKLKLIP